MTFVKVVKNKAYFKRFQVKFRRRREGKTDYYARRRLINQAKNKYNSPKYRLVVRITNRDIVCQIIYAKIQGDIVLSSAYAHELPKYGIKVGLTNWAATYATGLLLARRTLLKFPSLTKLYTGVAEPDGTVSEVEAVEKGPRPLKVFLDLGLAHATTGARIFAAMKGVSDGGIFVPHSEQRFPGYDRETSSLNSERLRDYIFAGHVSEYMSELEKDDPEKYRVQFSRFIANEITPDNLEEMYSKAHAAIRADPAALPKKKREADAKKPRKYHKTRLTLKQRRERVAKKKAKFFSSFKMNV